MMQEFQTPILMYHSVARHAPRDFGRFVVSPLRFKDQMKLLRDTGYNAISVREHVRRMRAGSIRENTVVLTFDDGFADFHSDVLPILLQFEFSATLYVVSGLVGRNSDWLPSTAGGLPLLDWRQIVDTASKGIEIGAHTISHPKLDCLPIAAARDEIAYSKRELEDHLGIEVGSFAYPFGFRTRQLIDLVAECGFESACAVRYKTCSNVDSVFDLPRHIVRGDMLLDEFELLVRCSPQKLRQALDCMRSNFGGIWRRSVRKVAL